MSVYQNAIICSTSASDSNLDPQNTQCVPACRSETEIPLAGPRSSGRWYWGQTRVPLILSKALAAGEHLNFLPREIRETKGEAHFTGGGTYNLRHLRHFVS